MCVAVNAEVRARLALMMMIERTKGAVTRRATPCGRGAVPRGS